MITTKHLTLAATGLAVTLAIGAGALTASAASPTETASNGTRTTLSVEDKCAREPQITERYQQAHQRITERLAGLQTRHDKAVADGHTRMANRLQRVIDRLTKADQRITARYDRFENWAQANCAG